MATDDYVQNLARLIHQKLDPSLTVYVEYSNEVWNYGPSFQQYQQVLAAASANPLIGQVSTIHKVAYQNAFRSMQISTIFDQVFGADRDRVKAELGGWANNSNFLSSGLNFINTNFGSPSQYFDGIAIAPYFNVASSIDKPGLTVDAVFASMNQTLNGPYLSWLRSHAALASTSRLLTWKQRPVRSSPAMRCSSRLVGNNIET